MGYSADDDKIIKAAVKAGKISGDYVRMWQHAIVADPAGTRRTLAELPAGWAATDPVRTARIVALGSSGGTVAASGDPFADGRERAILDSVGLPVADVPKPVMIRPGVTPDQYTPRQAQDAMQRRLGPRFHPGTQAPPPAPVYYFPSPNDTSYFDESTGRWVEKNPYKEI